MGRVPKGKDHLPTIHFQGRFVSFRDGSHGFLFLQSHTQQITLPKTNIATENRPSQRKLVFQPSIFSTYVSLPEGNYIYFTQQKLRVNLAYMDDLGYEIHPDLSVSWHPPPPKKKTISARLSIMREGDNSPGERLFMKNSSAKCQSILSISYNLGAAPSQ